jgi:hypothetical protein
VVSGKLGGVEQGTGGNRVNGGGTEGSQGSNGSKEIAAGGGREEAERGNRRKRRERRGEGHIAKNWDRLVMNRENPKGRKRETSQDILGFRDFAASRFRDLAAAIEPQNQVLAEH